METKAECRVVRPGSTAEVAAVVRARLVESIRGAGGGYRFCGNPKRVTLLDVISLFEEVGADEGEWCQAHGVSWVGGRSGNQVTEPVHERAVNGAGLRHVRARAPSAPASC